MHAIDEVRIEFYLCHDLAVTGAVHDFGRVDRFRSLIAPLGEQRPVYPHSIGRASLD